MGFLSFDIINAELGKRHNISTFAMEVYITF
jgi:hypothetical protein